MGEIVRLKDKACEAYKVTGLDMTLSEFLHSEWDIIMRIAEIKKKRRDNDFQRIGELYEMR